jgi:hypothetical protein
MKRILLIFLSIMVGSNINFVKGQDPIAPKAPLAKTTEPKEEIQNDKKAVSTSKSGAMTSTGTHLMFMGIPIDGTIDSFDKKISEKSFHKSSLGDYTGRFYGQFCVADTKINKNTDNVYEVLIRYNQSIAHYTKGDLILLYGNIVRDLKKKYPKAKCDETDSHLVLSMSQGFIECKIFSTIFGNMGGGVNLVVRYVDKTNSMSYNIPTVKRNEDDL